MDEGLKNVIKTLGGAAIDAGLKAVENRAKKPTNEKAKPSLTPRQIFGFAADVKLDETKIRKRYRELAAVFHPDLDAERTDTMMFSMLGRVRDQLLKELKT